MIATLLLTALLQSPEALYQESVQLLQSKKAPEAEAKAREALARSLRFSPEEEIGVRPDRGLLFEDMILGARKSYRERRSRYFRALGDALAAQKKWLPARKAYRRAQEIHPSSDIALLMAQHEDLDVGSRVDLLLDAYLAPGSDRNRLEAMLLETGVFLNRNSLKTSLDWKRFPALQARYPDLELLREAFPDFQAATDGGPFIPSQLFFTGASLAVYVPTDGCSRCSEELDGLTLPLREAQKQKLALEVAAFVKETDLPVARRIARLLAMPVRVGRKDAFPSSNRFFEEGEIRIVSRGGLTQIRIPTATLSSIEIRHRVEACLTFLSEPGLPTETRPEEASQTLVTLKRGDDDRRTFLEWVQAVERLEAGPAPLGSLYADLNRLAQHLVPDDAGREEAFELLESLGRIRGATTAKTRLLSLASERIGERLLEKAKSLEAGVRRTPSGEQGIFYLTVAGEEGGPRQLYLQRSFESENGLTHFDFVLEEDGGNLAVVWSAPEEKEPLGVEPAGNGAAFFFSCAAGGCLGARLVEGGSVVFEGEPAAVVEGRLVELRNALVDEPPNPESGPVFYRRVDEGAAETALERGLRLFEAGDAAGALAAFVEAEKEIDPIAPYDASDLVYNRARALEQQGKRREALALFRSLGDVSYQSLVDERARRIESGR